MEDWCIKWKFKINHSKYIHTTITLKIAPPPGVTLNGIPIPLSPIVKYFGLTLNKILTWAQRIRDKILSLNNRLRILKPLISN
jgi:hypothetical protein